MLIAEMCFLFREKQYYSSSDEKDWEKKFFSILFSVHSALVHNVSVTAFSNICK